MSHTFNHALRHGACVLLGGQVGAKVLGGMYLAHSGASQGRSATQHQPCAASGSSECEICALVKPPIAGRWRGTVYALWSVLCNWVQ